MPSTLSTILFTTLLSATALASPTFRQQSPSLSRPFELTVSSRNSAINGQPVTANNGELWIGAWPGQGQDPAAVTAPAAPGVSFVANAGGLSLPDNKAVYVSPSGVIKFASPNAKDDEPNSTRSGWIATPDASRGFGKLTFTSGRGGRSGFLACPVQSGWRLSVRLNSVPQGCSEVDLLIPKVKGEYPTGVRAWE